MFSQKLFKLLNKIALYAIVFASLAPSISHALAAKNGTSFAQEICTSNGQKISIQVTTSQGQQLTTELSASKELSVNNKQPTKNISMHLEHCPFCSSSATAMNLPASNTQIIAILEATAQKIAYFSAPVIVTRTYRLPPSQAPPSTL